VSPPPRTELSHRLRFQVGLSRVGTDLRRKVGASFVEDASQHVWCHGGEFLARSHPVSTGDIDGHADRVRRRSKDHYPAIRVEDLTALDAQPKTLDEASFGALQVRERLAAGDLSRASIGHAQHDRTTALIRERRAVLHELLEVEVVLCFLEFEVLALPGIEPVLQLSVQHRHRGASPRARSSAKS
jgi:hypothetical protein